MWRKLEELFVHQYWGIGLVTSPAADFLLTTFEPQVHWLPLDHFAADPMLVRWQDQTAILYEEFDYGSHRGRISAVLLDTSSASPTIKARYPSVIDTPFHCSYPFCIPWEGELYCVPEQSASGRSILYRCLEFPHRWAEERDILTDTPLVDPTLMQWNGIWWLMGTLRGQQPNAALWLYQADHPWGPWHRVGDHPIKSDLSSARPAGPIFTVNERWYRPAQDCSRRYGGALVLHEIHDIGPNGLRESLVRRIPPVPSGPYTRGIHHLASIEDLSVIDGLQHRFYWAQLRFELARLSKKILGGKRSARPVSSPR